jgi:hypothetical protein
MKSADARLQATGTFHTTAIRNRAFTSGSWGCGSSGSQNQQIDLVLGDQCPDLLVPAQRATLELVDSHPELGLEQGARKSNPEYETLQNYGTVAA